MVIQALKCKSKQIFFSRIRISMTFPWFFPGNGIPWFFHIREIFFTFSMISLISPWWWAPCKKCINDFMLNIASDLLKDPKLLMLLFEIPVIKTFLHMLLWFTELLHQHVSKIIVYRYLPSHFGLVKTLYTLNLSKKADSLYTLFSN